MSDLMKRNSFLTPDDTVTSKVGGTMVKAGLTGGALWLAAGFLPFVTFPMLLVAMIVFGVFMY